jgi:lysozyme
MVSSTNSSYDDELKTNTCKSMSARKKVSTPSKTSYPYYILACVVMLCVGLGITYFFLQNNIASAQEYPIKGFDVSHHQGDIQWQSISPQEFKFVYLKATEGGDFKDRKFQDNWLKAREQGFLVGAYHFYRLCRDGQIQAQNFIETVPKKTDSLPPVIDLEYDSTCINTYTREQLLKEIQVMHDQLYQHYGLQPIFYTSKAFYNIVLVDESDQYSTLSGYILFHLGRLPENGSSLEADGCIFEVVTMDGHKIEKVHVIPKSDLHKESS